MFGTGIYDGGQIAVRATLICVGVNRIKRIKVSSKSAEVPRGS